MFDRDGAIAFTFEAWLLRHNPTQRWAHFSNMHAGRGADLQDATTPILTRPTAFLTAPSTIRIAPRDVPPRASIEMRGTAYWFE